MKRLTATLSFLFLFSLSVQAELTFQEIRTASDDILVVYYKSDVIELDEVKVQQMLENIASNYEDSQQIIRHYRDNEQLMVNIKALVMEEQVVEWVLDRAKVNEEPLSYDQLISPVSVEAKS